MRRRMHLIFQDPYASLDPRMTAGDIIGEPLKVHDLDENRGYTGQVNELLKVVELAPYMADRYPQEFSGGYRQRIGGNSPTACDSIDELSTCHDT